VTAAKMKQVSLPFPPRRLLACLLLPIVLLAGCSSGSGSGSSPTASSGDGSPGVSSPAASPAVTTTTTVGVTVAGAFAATPKITVPATPAPTALTQQTLIQGFGAQVAKGDTLIADYVGQTWAPKSGKVNVFDSSYSRGSPAAFVIGVGAVIPGWDSTLVGKHLGSRVLLTLPPVDGYGPSGQSSANISGTDTLVFVVDLIAAYKPNASAPGTAVSKLPTTDFPKITNVVGKEPTILSTAGVKVPANPTSTLLVTGSGTKIDSSKTLVLQLVEAELANGQLIQASWGQAPQTVAAQSVLQVADKLTGQNVGSRVLVLLPATAAVAANGSQPSQAASPPEILIIDVVGQF
jgi:peptidylprolyl isomerase